MNEDFDILSEGLETDTPDTSDFDFDSGNDMTETADMDCFDAPDTSDIGIPDDMPSEIDDITDEIPNEEFADISDVAANTEQLDLDEQAVIPEETSEVESLMNDIPDEQETTENLSPEDISETDIDEQTDAAADIPETEESDIEELMNEAETTDVPPEEFLDADEAQNTEEVDIPSSETAESPEDIVSAETDSQIEIQEVDEINDWIKEINPNYDPYDVESPYSNNCGSCAFAVEQKLNGIDDISATSENIGTVEDMNKTTGMEQVAMSPDEIKDYLISQGPGAHGIVGIDRVSGPGHWFNAYYDGEKVVSIDGQTGEVNDWPPDYGDVTNWDISVRKEGT